MKQETETHLLNGSRMRLSRPGQLQKYGRRQNEARKGNIFIKQQQNARTAWDNYKNALRMPKAVPE